MSTWRGFLLARGTQVVSSYVCRQLNHPTGVGGGRSKNTAGQKGRLHSVCRSDRAGQEKGCTSFVARVLLSMASLEELSRAFFELSLGVAVDLGRGGILFIHGGGRM